MNTIEKLLILNAQQSLDLTKASVSMLGMIRTLAVTSEALEQATETIKTLRSQIELLNLDLAEARAGVEK